MTRKVKVSIVCDNCHTAIGDQCWPRLELPAELHGRPAWMLDLEISQLYPHRGGLHVCVACLRKLLPKAKVIEAYIPVDVIGKEGR